MDRIALAIGLDEKLAEFYSIYEILIYEKRSKWTVVNRFRVHSESKALSTVRGVAENIAKNLLERECKYIVGKEILGIPYQTLCKAGLEVFEADEINEELFDSIYEDFMIDKELTVEEIDVVPPRPIPIDDEGNYYLDFIKAITCHPELSSKKMLIPFLTNDLFYSLQIRCEHMMPWLEDFIKNHGLKMEVTRENGISQVLITHGCN